jgi:DNA-binding cell septation regulator SpoVG
MSAAIQVLAIRKLDGRSSVKAFTDLRIGGVTIKGAKIVQQDGQKAWLAMPSVKTDRAWQNIVELSKPLCERCTEAVLAAWETHQPARDHFDHGQHDTGDPGRPFDDSIPF